MACLNPILVASMVWTLKFLASTAKINSAPIISADATTEGLNKTCLIKSTAITQIITAGINAMKTFIAKRLAW